MKSLIGGRVPPSPRGRPPRLSTLRLVARAALALARRRPVILRPRALAALPRAVAAVRRRLRAANRRCGCRERERSCEREAGKPLPRSVHLLPRLTDPLAYRPASAETRRRSAARRRWEQWAAAVPATSLSQNLAFQTGQRVAGSGRRTIGCAATRARRRADRPLDGASRRTYTRASRASARASSWCCTAQATRSRIATRRLEAREAERAKNYTEQLRKRLWGDTA
jgi:hypothetical protein